MTTTNFQFPPTPSVDMVSEKRRCTPAWQKWFIDLVALIQSIKTTGINTAIAAHKFLAGPTSGVDALPTFRVIVNSDLPITTPTVPAELTLTGNVASQAGSLVLDKATQNANLVWAGPTTGAAAKPTFRALVTADIPGIAGAVVITTAKLTAGGTNGSMTFTNGVLTAHVDAT